MLNAKFLLTTLIVLIAFAAFPCSMYKITCNGKTMVGNNEDSWRLTSRIWFEPSKNGKYGAAFVGYSDRGNPEGGMNEYGLTYDGFSVLTRTPKDQSQKWKLLNYFDLRFVLKECKNINDAFTLLSKYDLSSLNGGMFLFTDKKGDYMVVETDTIIRGNNPNYVLANFCPSQTPDLREVKMERYKKGVEFLKNKTTRTDINFCTALSDTMSVCRPKMGDGTLYTSIYDTEEGIIYLNFYHDYNHQVKFNLKDELAKGEHSIDISSLFPPSTEYKKLASYKTPLNNYNLQIFTRLSFLLFFFSFLYFTITFFTTRRKGLNMNKNYKFTRLALATLNLILFYFTINLLTEKGLYYFSAPYKFPSHNLLDNLSVYLPFLLLILIVPLFRINISILKEKLWPLFSVFILTLNNLVYLSFIVLSAYWGFYNIFS